MTSPAHINIPSSIFIGAGAIDQVGPEVKRFGVNRLLIVSDPFMAKTEHLEHILQALQAGGIESITYGDVTPDPTDGNVLEGLALLKEHRCDGVLAFGGGSCIDAGKGIAVMATNSGHLSDYMGYNLIPKKGIPLFAIPTTAGTGSEMTRVTVITDTSRHVKMMILDPHLVPAAAFVDYTLTFTMPKPLTAHVGVDTLTHGLEAYVSRKANAMTDVFAISCIHQVGQHLQRAWHHPDDAVAREGMMLAASHGGMAFANSSVCLVHGMSRPLGGMFHLPHGLSNAILLPAVTRYSVSSAQERYSTVAKTLGWAEVTETEQMACDKLVSGLEALNASVEIPRLRDCDISEENFMSALDKMAEDALASGSPQNNPRVPTLGDIKKLYLEAY
ncbi:MAG TPA: alcohol dehydrogenase [Candidatus Latescibacteria bacterium]|nr:alcohol dehydrogenase [Candidatus Latescibacterota bacterium]